MEILDDSGEVKPYYRKGREETPQKLAMQGPNRTRVLTQSL